MDKIEQFLQERGVRAVEPTRPRETFPEYWARTARWLQASRRAADIVAELGPAQARDVLNMAIGAPIYATDRRLIPQLQREDDYGFILLPGGCKWALEHGGRCAFCEFQSAVDEAAGDLPFSHEEFMALFGAGFATMQSMPMMNIFTAGSFLNPGEMPMRTQAAIAQAVADSPSAEILRIESRVQYMVEETIKPIADIMNAAGKTLDIAIGFETQDDHLRNKVLRKGMSRNGFVRAVQEAKRLGARVSAYVMLMPVEMEEGFAAQECAASIRFAFETGADEVLLQARYSQHEQTRCPWLWTIAKVLQETAHLGPVMLGKWEGELPPPVVWPQNCSTCSAQVMEALAEWRKSLHPGTISEATLPDCACKVDWAIEAAKTDAPPRAHSLPTVP